MNYDDTYPAPVYGISTLSPRDRRYGTAEEQINFRSDPVSKLTRRPPAKWKAKLASIASDVISHEYLRNGAVVRVIVAASGVVKAFIDNVEKTVTGDISAYLGTSVENLVLKTVNDTTFILNKTKVIKMSTGTDTMIERVTHVNITSALNYGETVRLRVRSGDTGLFVEYVYSVPDLGSTPSYDAADKARATNAVAKGLADLINGDSFAYAKAKYAGSSIAIWSKTIPTDWVEVEVASGQGDKSVVAVNNTIEDIAGLPRYAVHGTHIRVQPNPDSTKGVYYLTARATREGATVVINPDDRLVEEVVWAESRSNTEPYHLLPETLPHVLEYNAVTGTFTVGTPSIGWADRKSGDNISCRVPVFVNKTIEHMGYFQKRLVFVSDNSVVMSRTDDIFNFWRQSAVSLLVTDPVSADASTTDIDKLNYITNHNKDLLIVTRNAQLKIQGDIPVTPETIAMPVVTEFDVSVSAEPTALGNSIMLPLSYGASSGLSKYEREKDREQDNASDISSHVVGLITGKIISLTASSNLEMVIARNSVNKNTLFVYEQFTYGAENRQQSWSKWVFPFDIVSAKFINNALSILYRSPTTPADLHAATLEFHTRTGELDKVFLDKSIQTYLPDGATIPLPAGYDTTGCLAVSVGENLKYISIPYVKVGDVLVLTKNLGVGARVILGVPISASYRPTRPFKRDEDGTVLTSDHIRLQKFTLHVVQTGCISMRTISKYYADDTQRFIARELGSDTSLLGTRALHTGDVSFAFLHDANLSVPEFFTDDYMGATISGISWSGQYNQRRRRL